MFQLNEHEVESMVSQNAIPSKQHLGGSLPYVFTEHGVLMLSTVLKSEIATKMSIRLIEIFVQLRKALHSYNVLKIEIEEIKKLIIQHHKDIDSQGKNIDLIFNYIDRLQEKAENPNPTERKQIGYEVGKEKDKK